MIVAENAAGDGFSAQTPVGGQKVGYGTSVFNGLQANKLDSVNYQIASGSLANRNPYINLWVSDGTHFAILALGGEYRGMDFDTTTLGWTLYEYNTAGNTSWLFKNSAISVGSSSHLINDPVDGFTLSDVQDSITIVSPSSPYPSYVGTGAPREGYGFNILFGDTAANYVGAMSISELSVTYDGVVYNAGNVPDAGSSMVLLGIAVAGLGALARRRP